MSKNFLGLDYGTGGAKAVLVDENAVELAHAYEEYPIIVQRDGYSEHDAAHYWPVACRLIRSVLAESGICGNDVACIAVSSALPSMVLVDKHHEPLANAYNLMDRRATKQVTWLKENIGDKRIFEISKNRLDDHPIIVNMMWERENRPDVFGKIWKTLTIDGYVTLRLTGLASCHYSGAAFYGVAYDLLKRKFDAAILSAVDISPDLFPSLFRCEAIVGEVTREAAAATGLAAGVPVAAGQVDCNAGWVGAGAVSAGDIQMNLGTCGNFGVILSQPKFHESMINFAYTTDSENTYITVPTTTTGGQLIRYLRDNFYPAENRQMAESGGDVYELITSEAESAPSHSGLVMLPYLMGERTPIWDNAARGVVFGLSLNHTRGCLAKAMMEATAFALYDSFAIIQKDGQKFNLPIVLNEGGAKNPLWRRIITDVFNQPTALVERRSGAPYGDAILAGVAAGHFPDFSVAKRLTRLIDEMQPDKAAHQRYMDYFALYKSIYQHVKNDFIELARIRDQHSSALP